MDLCGELLVAMPGMGDARFERAVILICAHGKDGAMGLVVNKPARDLSFSGLLDQLNLPKPASGRDIRVHIGGPMERGRGFVLHSPDYSGGATTLRIGTSLGMTATLDVLEAISRGNGPRHALLALGYSGWGPGQLEAELAANSWLTASGTGGFVFDADDAGKWAGALRGIGVDPVTLSGSAGRA